MTYQLDIAIACKGNQNQNRDDKLLLASSLGLRQIELISAFNQRRLLQINIPEHIVDSAAFIERRIGFDERPLVEFGSANVIEPIWLLTMPREYVCVDPELAQEGSRPIHMCENIETVENRLRMIGLEGITSTPEDELIFDENKCRQTRFVVEGETKTITQYRCTTEEIFDKLIQDYPKVACFCMNNYVPDRPTIHKIIRQSAKNNSCIYFRPWITATEQLRSDDEIVNSLFDVDFLPKKIADTLIRRVPGTGIYEGYDIKYVHTIETLLETQTLCHRISNYKINIKLQQELQPPDHIKNIYDLLVNVMNRADVDEHISKMIKISLLHYLDAAIANTDKLIKTKKRIKIGPLAVNGSKLSVLDDYGQIAIYTEDFERIEDYLNCLVAVKVRIEAN